MASDEFTPRLRIREVLLVVLSIGAVVAVFVIRSVTAAKPSLAAPLAQRLKINGGNYQLHFPPHTTLAEARAVAERGFPRDTRRKYYSEKAFCIVEVLTSISLERRVSPGVVAIEFLSPQKRADEFPLLDKRNIATATVSLLDSTEVTPSC
jgi:hypothetical protein